MQQLAYIKLPSDNGGIVLDISEGGLGFLAVAPIESDGPIRFRFSAKPITGLEAIGELAWKDQSGKSGGIRFTHVPEQVREQIRIWSGQQNMELSDIAVAAKPIETNAGVNHNTAENTKSNQIVPRDLNPSAFVARNNPLTMFPVQSSSATEELVIRQKSTSSRKTFIALVLMISLTSFVVTGLLSYLYIRKSGESPIRLVEKIWREFRPSRIVPPASLRNSPESLKPSSY